MNPVGLKAILILGGLLLLSSAGNIFLAKRMWQQEQKDADAAVLAKTAAERDGLKFTAAVNEAIAGQKALDTSALLADLRGIAEAARPVRVQYRTAAAAKPLGASCSPGQGRVDAVNARLGPQPPAAATPGARP